MQRSSTPSPARIARSWLERDPSFRDLARQVGDLVALQAALRKVAPKVQLTVSGLADGTLTVVVPGAAWATRLRQIEPSLVAALAREGFRVQRLKIRPLRETAPPAPAGRPKQPVPATALSALEALRSGLEPSPLREALERLVARHRRGPTGPTGARK